MKLVISLVVALTILSACGKKGELDSPEPSPFPRTYPKESR